MTLFQYVAFWVYTKVSLTALLKLDKLMVNCTFPFLKTGP
jgi:hypothetical protein